jgi:hypothetical protein
LLASTRLNTDDELALRITELELRIRELAASDVATLLDILELLLIAGELLAARDAELTGLLPQGAPLMTGISAAAAPLVP